MKKKTQDSLPPKSNPLLPAELQGRRYVIKRVMLQPVVTLLTEAGLEEYDGNASVAIKVMEAGFDKTIRQIMTENRLPMESPK